MIIGRPTYFFESLASTNDYAAQLIHAKEPVEGTIIDTAHQTQGHGQKGRIWNSPQGANITLSIILRPHWLDIERQFMLNVMASLAIMETVSAYVANDVKVKWPNDVYVNHHKISGILIHNGLQGKLLNYSIIGIGLNVNQTTWPEEILYPTSLARLCSHQMDIAAVKERLLENVEKYYHVIRQNPSCAFEQYQRALYRRDEVSDIYLNDTHVRGIIRKIDPYGRLMVATIEGQQLFEVGEISFSKPL